MPAHYVPILKGKAGEYGALQVATPQVRAGMTPLIDIPPVPWDYQNDAPAKAIDDHLAPIAGKLETSWGTDQSLFVDLGLIDQDQQTKDGLHVFTHVLGKTREKAIQAIPVTGLARADSYQEAVRIAAQADNRGVCVRLEPSDFEVSEDLAPQLESLLGTLGVETAHCDLVIDIQSIYPKQVSTTTLGIVGTLSLIPQVTAWRTLTLAASAFPENLSGIRAATEELLPRSEWLVWQSLATKNLARLPAFGDYGINNPEMFEMDPRMMSMSAGLRYTTENEWLILKGRGVKKHGFEQFNALCKKLVARDEYAGQDFSWGDSYIRRCANDEDGPGNATTWRKAGTSHHLAKVVGQLAALDAS